MKEKINLKSIIAGLITFIIGVLAIIADKTFLPSGGNLAAGIGCSLIGSAVVIILTDLVVDRVKENPLDVWGIKQIYSSRTKMNDDCDVSLRETKHNVDVVALGLKSYRSDQDKLTKSLLENGVNFRIITMCPDSPYVAEREREENEADGQIRKTIEDLVAWANALNKRGYDGKITVKGYNCMTLDFYWRADNDIYVGPYWYDTDSQSTISFKFEHGKGANAYMEYFDKLWNDKTIMKTLTR